MFLYLGGETAVFDKDIIGIFDLDNATVSKTTRDYLNKAEKDKKLKTELGEDLPKSFVVLKNEQVILSQIAPNTAKKRLLSRKKEQEKTNERK